MPNDRDDDPEEQEENSQEEFINSDEFSSSLPCVFTYRFRSTGSVYVHKEIEKTKTVNFYCIVDYAYWGPHVKKNAPSRTNNEIIAKTPKSQTQQYA
jgi:hypothetical protein